MEPSVKTNKDADTEYLVRRSMTKGYQLGSLMAPPLYVGFVLTRRRGVPFSINRFLRATWIGGAAGLVGGGAFGYVRSVNSSAETLRTRRLRAVYDNASMRADDHATIGAIVFSTLTTAVLWNRARTIHLILGGAGLGSDLGLLVHGVKTLSGDVAGSHEPVPPVKESSQ